MDETSGDMEHRKATHPCNEQHHKQDHPDAHGRTFLLTQVGYAGQL